jgi:hypothetical protein
MNGKMARNRGKRLRSEMNSWLRHKVRRIEQVMKQCDMERLISPPAGSIVEVRLRRQNLRNWCTRPSEANGREEGEE